MKSPAWQLTVHVLGGLAFLALPYIFAPNGLSQLLHLTSNPHELTSFASYLFMLGFFYLNYYYLIPALYFPKKYVRYALSIGAAFGIIFLLLASIDRTAIGPEMYRGRFEEHGHPPPPSNAEASPHDFPPPPSSHQMITDNKPPMGFELSHALFLFLVGVFVSLALRINHRLRQTESEKLNTELSFLKAQINPHFLFNTLNSIYSLAIEQSPHTADAVVKLSSLMRYVMREAATDWVALEHELGYISNYVALQKLRLGDTVELDFGIEGKPNGHKIAPLILISFIENAFKYGVNPQEKSLIQLRISVKEGVLTLTTFNKKVRVFYDEEAASGIGIENTRTRLELLYPDDYELKIGDSVDSFTVDLQLRIA
ncbi:hypothetical protein FHS57_003261 [Runella defluvii]|uniref:Signal transduction histidine kinase internal region domain-containing protein n=1 Tax=Runella defluvii TaxID=370973 RepID=A0A7W5ZLA5_9BACT|nr:sensor histidine kinase [Runella defluvii]MBB3839255.1 hypothetical protein [Runella defluvii]